MVIKNSIDANDTSYAVGEYYSKAKTNCKHAFDFSPAFRIICAFFYYS